MILNLYNKYFQKSKIFLYPFLELPKVDEKYFTIQTYLKYKDISIEECFIICVYNIKDVEYFTKYKKEKINRSIYFTSEETIDENKHIVIFNISKFKTDYHYFMLGQYSKFSSKSKDLIKKYFGARSPQYVYVDTFINPKDYYNEYSTLLDVSKETLEEVVELCDKFDYEKEWLNTENS